MPDFEPIVSAVETICGAAGKGAPELSDGVLKDAGIIGSAMGSVSRKSLLGVTHISIPGTAEGEDITATINPWTRRTTILGPDYKAVLPWSDSQALVKFADGTEVTLTPAQEFGIDSVEPTAEFKLPSGARGNIYGNRTLSAPLVHLFPAGSRNVFETQAEVDGARLASFNNHTVVQFDNGARTGPLDFLINRVAEINLPDGSVVTHMRNQPFAFLTDRGSIIGSKFYPKV